MSREADSASTLLQRAASGGRLERDEALRLWNEASLHEMGRSAHQLRMRRHPHDTVTYVVDRNINYSNVCVCGCRFCAFFRPPGDPQGFVISREDLYKKIQEAVGLGATQILMQGSHHPHLDLDFYLDLLRGIKERFPGIHLHAFSPPEIIHFRHMFGLSVREILSRLIEAGLDSIPGGGAEILVERVREEIAPNKCSAKEWLEVMRTAHSLGLKTTATMMFGHVEEVADRLEHLLALRRLQDETGGFTAFIPWTFQPDNTRIPARKTTSTEYLRTLALSRLVLDNITNLQASWVTMGAKIAQLSLFFGANDFGSTMIEENVVAASGVRFRMSREEIDKHIREAGFVPRKRRMDYTFLE